MLYATVVLYNPNEDLYNNIMSYYNYVEKIILIDNSEKEINIEEILMLEKIQYIKLGKNMGIAYALKKAMDEAISLNVDFILTMDQDSKYFEDSFKYIPKFLKENDMSNIGILSSVISLLDKKKCTSNKYEQVDIAITSGSVINVQLYKSINGFDSDLFIDCVDFDLCRQFIENGNIIIQLNEAILLHELGDSKKRKIFNKEIIVSRHSPIRYYYYFRNFYFCKRKTKFSKKYFKNMHKDTWKMLFKLFMYEDNKFKKLKMILKGRKDAKINKLGKYND